MQVIMFEEMTIRFRRGGISIGDIDALRRQRAIHFAERCVFTTDERHVPVAQFGKTADITKRFHDQ